MQGKKTKRRKKIKISVNNFFIGKRHKSDLIILFHFCLLPFAFFYYAFIKEKKIIQSYRDLIVWQKAMKFVTEVYKVTKTFPSEELYCLTSQIRRSAVSIPSNIAEGYGRRATNDYVRFLTIASGSVYETQTQLEISMNLGYLPELEHKNLAEKSKEIEMMLNSLINKIKTK